MRYLLVLSVIISPALACTGGGGGCCCMPRMPMGMGMGMCMPCASSMCSVCGSWDYASMGGMGSYMGGMGGVMVPALRGQLMALTPVEGVMIPGGGMGGGPMVGGGGCGVGGVAMPMGGGYSGGIMGAPVGGGYATGIVPAPVGGGYVA
ncbi:unnamed protein product [Anisakis simplex]|uniref:Chorion class B protein Ld10 n=1 Tax=Anisakis simplex TaxID=6269 RepID=A0A0M3K6J2_ANISI|nr:unnamed protein product [Anisakis simplex]